MEVPFYGPDEILKLKDKINTLNTDYMAQKPCILAVETSSRIGSVAIAFGQEIFAETVFSCPLMHSAEIFPAINTLLKSANRRPNQIEHVYISSGPGSFTGLRIATTLAKAMHIANSVKIVTVDTLDVIACNSVDYVRDSIDRKSRPGKSKISIERIATIIDAKRGQFFIAVYNCNLYEADTKNAIFSKQYEKILPDTLMSASEFKQNLPGRISRFGCLVTACYITKINLRPKVFAFYKRNTGVRELIKFTCLVGKWPGRPCLQTQPT